jgi:hypothetical protein
MKMPEAQSTVKWQDVGACGFCLMTIEAQQPGGLNTRHKSTQTPYGQCPQAVKAREARAKEKM